MYGIVANVASDKALRSGAKVLILFCNGDAENPKVKGLSKSGRIIEKYTKYKRLKNFRAAWVHKKHDSVRWLWGDRSEAEVFAGKLSNTWEIKPKV